MVHEQPQFLVSHPSFKAKIVSYPSFKAEKNIQKSLATKMRFFYGGLQVKRKKEPWLLFLFMGLVEEGNRSDGRSQLKGGQAAGNAT